jgi:hypothetical protein
MDSHTFVQMLFVSDEDSVGKLVNDFAARYRKGAPTTELLPLLTHPDSRVVCVGAWVASEVVNERRGRDIFLPLSRLLEHDDPAVRFEALASVPRLVQANEPTVVLSILRLLADEDPGVRRQALSQVCLMPDSLFSDRRLLEALPDVVLLLDGVTKSQIRAGMHRRLLVQRLAVAGALRNYGIDPEFMSEIEEQSDTEVRETLPTLARGRSF